MPNWQQPGQEALPRPALVPTFFQAEVTGFAGELWGDSPSSCVTATGWGCFIVTIGSSGSADRQGVQGMGLRW